MVAVWVVEIFLIFVCGPIIVSSVNREIDGILSVGIEIVLISVYG